MPHSTPHVRPAAHLSLLSFFMSLLTYGTLRAGGWYVKGDIIKEEEYDDARVCDPWFTLEGRSQRVRSDAADGWTRRIFLECEAQPDLPRVGEAGGWRLRDAQRGRATREAGQEGL